MPKIYRSSILKKYLLPGVLMKMFWYHMNILMQVTAAEMLELVYGDLMTGTVQNELVTTHNLHTVYKIPAAIKNIFNNRFPFCIQSHQSSLLINFEKNNKDLLYCNFYPEHLTVMLRKNGQLQMIQQFEYTLPEDAVYHLLNVCQSFDTDAAKTILTVSGMIDTDSSLYSELYKYFQSVNCARFTS